MFTAICRCESNSLSLSQPLTLEPVTCRQVGKITTAHAATSDVNLADRSAKKSGCC